MFITIIIYSNVQTKTVTYRLIHPTLSPSTLDSTITLDVNLVQAGAVPELPESGPPYIPANTTAVCHVGAQHKPRSVVVRTFEETRRGLGTSTYLVRPAGYVAR